MAMYVAVPFFLAFFFAGRTMVRLFMKGESTMALDTGMRFLKIVSPFYFVVAVKLMADGVLRGAGVMKQFMVTTLTDLILRVVLSYLFADLWGTTGIWLSWPVGWSVAAVLSVIFYLQGKWKPQAAAIVEGD